MPEKVRQSIQEQNESSNKDTDVLKQEEEAGKMPTTPDEFVDRYQRQYERFKEEAGFLTASYKTSEKIVKDVKKGIENVKDYYYLRPLSLKFNSDQLKLGAFTVLSVQSTINKMTDMAYKVRVQAGDIFKLELGQESTLRQTPESGTREYNGSIKSTELKLSVLPDNAISGVLSLKKDSEKDETGLKLDLKYKGDHLEMSLATEYVSSEKASKYFTKGGTLNSSLETKVPIIKGLSALGDFAVQKKNGEKVDIEMGGGLEYKISSNLSVVAKVKGTPEGFSKVLAGVSVKDMIDLGVIYSVDDGFGGITEKI